MTSIRCYKYHKDDINTKRKQDFIKNLGNSNFDIKTFGWNVDTNSIISKNDEIFFILQKLESKEILTLDGKQEFSYIEPIPIIVFTDLQIVAILKIIPKRDMSFVGCINQAILNKNNTHRAIPMESNEELMNKLVEEDSINVKGSDSRNALGVDRVAIFDRTGLKTKEIYEQTQAGISIRIRCEKKFDELGKIEFKLRDDGLITILKREYPIEKVAVIVRFVSNYLVHPIGFPPTLAKYQKNN